MNDDRLHPQEFHRTFDSVMKQVLDLGQSSLPEKQFLAFRKMIMDFFAEGKRNLNGGKGRCSSCKLTTKRGVDMGE